MFQAKIKGWKRLAASLVLLPGLTAVGAEVLHLLGTARAQESVNTRSSVPPKAATGDDPHLLVKRAREALEFGRLDMALDMARQAEANGRDTKWGLFEDTPESVLKDVLKARGRLDRQKAERLVGEARRLYEKRTGTDEVRAANLDKARSLCLEALQLQGPSSMWYFGDKPESLIKDIDNVRSKMSVAARPVNRDTTATARPDPQPDYRGPELRNPNTAANTQPNTEYRMPERRTSDVAINIPPTPPLLYPMQNPGYDRGLPVSQPSNNAPAEPEGDALGGGTVVSKPIRQNKHPVLEANVGVPLPARTDVVVNPAPTLDIGPNSLPQLPDQPSTPIPSKTADEVVKLPLPGETTGIVTLPGKIEVKAAPNPNKLQAVQLMKQAGAFQNENKFAEARRALVDAQQLKASFGPDEDTPAMALQSLMATAQKRINGLCHEAAETMVKKTAADLAVSEQKLNEANGLANEFSFDLSAINDHKLMLRAIKQHMELVASAKPMTMEPTNSDAPMVVLPPVPVPVEPQVAVKPVDQGMELLKQARMEMHDGRFDSARRIANEILVGEYSHKTEAEAVLRTCEAQELEIHRVSNQRSFERGVEALQSRNYEQALSIFKLVDPTLLPPAKRKAMADYTVSATQAMDKKSLNVVQIGVPPVNPEKTGADSLVKQEEAMRELQFQKLRAEGLQLEASATARFGKGDTEAAVQDLSNFIVRVENANIDPAKRALLERPVESRIERLKLLKHQQDFFTKEAKGLKDFRTNMTQEELQKTYNQEETGRLMKRFAKLMDEGKYQEAGKVALQAKELDPENPVVTSAMHLAQMKYRTTKWNNDRAEDENTTYKLNNPAGYMGPVVDVRGEDGPVHFDKDRFLYAQKRQGTSSGTSQNRLRSPSDRRIESELETQRIPVNFNNEPLDRALLTLQTMTGLNFDLDTRALEIAGIDPKKPITACFTNKMTLKNALDAVLRKANLSYVVEKEVVRVTTQEGLKGKLVRQTIPVTDLIVPVQNYIPSSVTDLNKTLEMINGYSRLCINGSSMPAQPQSGLNNSTGQAVGSSSAGNRGMLQNVPSGSGSASGVTIGNPNGTIEETLIRLITSSVEPNTWEAMGGPGRIEYYPLGMALVINQTPDVIEEVIGLLDSLRQLQDLEVAIEVRMITLAESFYERIGLDFSMNVQTGSKNALVKLSGSTASQNDPTNLSNVGARLVGLAAPGVVTPDLNLPISPSSFGLAIPPFGGYPNAPGADGGLSLGLAFLSDVQVQMFLEAAQGDSRTNVMQAPKLTMFNGQSASLSVQDQQFFLTGITVSSVSGVLVFTPQNNPFPIGVQMNLQPVISGDRRFVRLNIQQSMTNIASANVPLFPITTIITPTFDGGIQGQPIPFTQYIQQPTMTTISVSTTVVVPDGGTVLLGGMKTLSEGRQEYGPPVLSKIPYIDRLFRNVGYGRDAQSLMMMVTPRIIINREEQELQTGVIDRGSEP